jgi:sugar phosphate isomerase/epimerase
MKIGAQLYTLREYMKTSDDVFRTFERVKKIGYDNVQVSGIGANVAPEDVAKAAKDNELSIVATHMGWGQFLEETDRVIEIHHMWGCRHSGIGSLSGVMSIEVIDDFAKQLEVLAPKLTAAGLTFFFHNHSRELFRVAGKAWLAHLYERIPAEHLKAELDVYWITAGGGDPAAWIRSLPGRQPVVHLKDMTVLEDQTQRFAPVGSGNLNWRAIFDACRDAGVEYGVVEQDVCYGADPFDCLESSLRYIQANL